MPNPEEDLAAPPDAPREVVSAVVAQQAASGGVINPVINEEIAGEMSAPDEEEDVVDPVAELISRPLPVGAPLWAAEVRSLLKEVKDMSLSQISVALQDWVASRSRRPGRRFMLDRRRTFPASTSSSARTALRVMRM